MPNVKLEITDVNTDEKELSCQMSIDIGDFDPGNGPSYAVGIAETIYQSFISGKLIEFLAEEVTNKNIGNEKGFSDESLDKLFSAYFDEKARSVHQTSIDKGWWEAGKENRNRPEMICLMHSELSEALEALRDNNTGDHLPDLDPVGVELADCVIRIMDYCAAFDIPIGECIVAKSNYNKKRKYKHGGKKF